MGTNGSAGFTAELVAPTWVSRRVFTDAQIYEEELERIFRGGWVYVGLEAEVPTTGSFKATSVGDVPVIVSRTKDGSIAVLENSCPHKGAQVVREPLGTCSKFTCLYHQWTFALDGRLLGVPLQVQYGDRLDKKSLALAPARVETFSGLIFASFDPAVEPLVDYLGSAAPHLEEMLYGGDLVVLGYHRFEIKANWKLLYDNSLDAYHALQLHKFADALGVVPHGENLVFGNGHGVVKWPVVNLTEELVNEMLVGKAFQLQDRSIFLGADRPEGSFNRVLGVFPNVVLLEEWDMLVARQILPTGPRSMEVHAAALGLGGETPERHAQRARNFAHMFGPAGFAGLDDVVACEVVQRACDAPGYERTLLALGDVDAESGDLNGEYTLRALYRAYADRMGVGAP